MRIKILLFISLFFLLNKQILSQDFNDSVQYSINNAKHFFNSKDKKLDPLYIASILHFLNRKFNASITIDWQKFYCSYEDMEDDYNIELFKRMYNAVYEVPSLETINGLPNEMDCFTLQAMYCDKFKIDYNNYRENIYLFISEGNYLLTHAFLGLIWMKENGCYDELIERKKNEDNLISKLTILLNNTEDFDLYAETVAFLLYNGNRDIVNKNHIRKIINNQLPEGGWERRISDKDKIYTTVDDHASALALWALLEYYYPSNNTKINWLYH